MTKMQISDIMQKWSPAYPENGTWEDTIEILLEDEVEKDILNLLKKELKANGEFREPIILSEEEDEDTKNFYVMDGTHRLVSAYLSGVKEIDVQFGFSQDDYENYLVTYIDNIKKHDMSKIDNNEFEEIAEEIFSKFRSFYIDKDTWVVCDVGSCNGYFMFMWSGSYSAELSEKINTTIENKAKKLLSNYSFTVKTVLEKYED